MSEKKHDCEKWFDEAKGCSICSNIILKHPVNTKEKFMELIKECDYMISKQDLEIKKLKSQVLALRRMLT